MKMQMCITVTPSVRNIVAILPLERLYRSVFLQIRKVVFICHRQRQPFLSVNSRRVCRITMTQTEIYLKWQNKNHPKFGWFCFGAQQLFRAELEGDFCISSFFVLLVLSLKLNTRTILSSNK